MTTLTDIPVGQLQDQDRQAWRDRVLPVIIAAVGTAIGWGKTSRPLVVRAGIWIPDAIAAVFVAAGWVLGFAVFCLRGAVYGFCSGAGIPQPAELIARRRAAGQERQPPNVPGRANKE